VGCARSQHDRPPRGRTIRLAQPHINARYLNVVEVKRGTSEKSIRSTGRELGGAPFVTVELQRQLGHDNGPSLCSHSSSRQASAPTRWNYRYNELLFDRIQVYR
jgi:hypothetical protein